MNLNEALKTRSLQIRNIAFFVLLASFFLPKFGWFAVFIIPVAPTGLVVVLLTIRLNESIIQK
jgi:hypothetical protein